jgi:hypothetical protein
MNKKSLNIRTASESEKNFGDYETKNLVRKAEHDYLSPEGG